MTAVTTEVQPVKATWPESLQPLAEELRQLDTDALREVFREAIAMTVTGIVRAAASIRLLEERGEDLDELGNYNLFQMLRRVAYGSVLPEVVARFQGSSSVMRKIAALPIPDQRRLVEDRPLAVVVVDGEAFAHRLIPPSRMTPKQLQQVFAGDHIRDQAEQRTWLEERRTRTPRRGASGVVVDMKRRCLIVTGEKVVLTAKELNQYLQRFLEK